MVVASDWDDKTWHLHLAGYLSLIKQSCVEVSGRLCTQRLQRALQHVQNDTEQTFSFDDVARDDEQKSMLLLEISKLRLERLTGEFGTLMQGTTRPRKLDVQKLRSLFKQVFDDLGLIRPTSSSTDFGTSCVVQLEHATLSVVVGRLIIECGDFLDATGAFNTTREHAKLISVIRVATQQILDITNAIYPRVGDNEITGVHHDKATESRLLVMSSPLSVIWPLFAVSISIDGDSTQQSRARQALFHIGTYYRIPLALHLVRSPS